MLSTESIFPPCSIPCPDPLAVIRQGSSQCHSRIENAVDWREAFATPANYGQLLRGFYRVVEPLETSIRGSGRWHDQAGVASRSTRLRQDIEAVTSKYALADCGPLDTLAPSSLSFVCDWPTALGALYVLEGSALGGQILARQLREATAHWLSGSLTPRAHQNGDQLIDSYFIGRGAGTALHWHAFCQQLKSELIDMASAQAAAAAAVLTFECFHLCLAGKPACIRQ